MTVGERIRVRRVELGLTQADLTGPKVTNQHVSKIELGQRVPSMKALRVIAPLLGVTTHWLETGEEDRLDRYEAALRRIAEECQYPEIGSRRKAIRAGQLAKEALA